jgi:predicted AAA+ superfamily ATPase
MEERKILEILVDWNYWGNFKEEFKERPMYLHKLNNFLEGKEAIVIKGVRRAGKIFYCLSLSKKFDLKKR